MPAKTRHPRQELSWTDRASPRRPYPAMSHHASHCSSCQARPRQTGTRLALLFRSTPALPRRILPTNATSYRARRFSASPRQPRQAQTCWAMPLCAQTSRYSPANPRRSLPTRQVTGLTLPALHRTAGTNLSQPRPTHPASTRTSNHRRDQQDLAVPASTGHDAPSQNWARTRYAGLDRTHSNGTRLDGPYLACLAYSAKISTRPASPINAGPARQRPTDRSHDTLIRACLALTVSAKPCQPCQLRSCLA